MVPKFIVCRLEQYSESDSVMKRQAEHQEKKKRNYAFKNIAHNEHGGPRCYDGWCCDEHPRHGDLVVAHVGEGDMLLDEDMQIPCLFLGKVKHGYEIFDFHDSKPSFIHSWSLRGFRVINRIDP